MSHSASNVRWRTIISDVVVCRNRFMLTKYIGTGTTGIIARNWEYVYPDRRSGVLQN